ncbi:MAG: hypothetical protein RI900_2671 [Actinomycetota bacterium]
MPKRPTTSDDGQKIAELAATLWEHRDELARLATELPKALEAASAQMRDAGAGAQSAGKYLSGDVKKFAGHAADVLQESKHQLLAVLHALEGAGKMLRNMPLIGDMGKAMSEHLGAIGDVADNLDVVGKQVRGLGNRLADVGSDLGTMGTALVGSAHSLSMSPQPASAAPRKSATKSTAKKPAAKTAAKAAPKAGGSGKAAGQRPVAAKKASPAKKAASKKK